MTALTSRITKTFAVATLVLAVSLPASAATIVASYEASDAATASCTGGNRGLSRNALSAGPASCEGSSYNADFLQLSNGTAMPVDNEMNPFGVESSFDLMPTPATLGLLLVGLAAFGMSRRDSA